MKSYKNIYKSGAPPGLPFRRPTVFTLLTRIAESALTGGVWWFVFFGGVLVAFMHVNHMSADTVLVLMIFAVLTNAFISGIRAWQYDIEEYRRSLTEYRMNMANIRNKRQVKKAIVWDRH